MAKKVTTFQLHQLLKEIRESDGLPENLSTEAQLWDEIFKKEVFLMAEQLFPLIQEIHGISYPSGTPIKPLATEFSVERSSTKEISSIRADITVLVGTQDIYHFECQIENDGTMVLRMFEYDIHIALSYSSTIDSKIRLRFPHSAVLYLQDNRNTPDELICQVQFQDGGTYEYRVPALKVQSYSLEEIQQKHLCVLIPFLPLRFRKHLSHDKKTGKTRFDVEKETLTSFYQHLILILDEEVASGFLSTNNRNTILSLLNKSMVRVFYRDDTLIKEVIEMTEPILELEIEKYMRQSEETFQRLEQASQQLEHTSQELEHTSLELEHTSQEREHTSLELEHYKKADGENKKLIASLQEQIATLQKQLSLTT